MSGRMKTKLFRVLVGLRYLPLCHPCQRKMPFLEILFLEVSFEPLLYTPPPLLVAIFLTIIFKRGFWASFIYPCAAPVGEKGNVGSSMEAAAVSAAQPELKNLYNIHPSLQLHDKLFI